jgi:hypothetical protein
VSDGSTIGESLAVELVHIASDLIEFDHVLRRSASVSGDRAADVNGSSVRRKHSNRVHKVLNRSAAVATLAAPVVQVIEVAGLQCRQSKQNSDSGREPRGQERFAIGNGFPSR